MWRQGGPRARGSSRKQKGANGPYGRKGGKGEPAQAPQRNWKQCAWQEVNDVRNYGMIKITAIGSPSQSFSSVLLKGLASLM